MNPQDSCTQSRDSCSQLWLQLSLSAISCSCMKFSREFSAYQLYRDHGAVLLCGSLCLSGLCLWLTSGVPESGNVEGIAFDIIDNLVEPTYYDAAVGLSTMGEKRVNLAHRGHVGQGMRSLFNLVHEFLTDALAKIPQDVFLYLMQLGGGSFVPVNLHTLTFPCGGTLRR